MTVSITVQQLRSLLGRYVTVEQDNEPRTVVGILRGEDGFYEVEGEIGDPLTCFGPEEVSTIRDGIIMMERSEYMEEPIDLAEKNGWDHCSH